MRGFMSVVLVHIQRVIIWYIKYSILVQSQRWKTNLNTKNLHKDEKDEKQNQYFHIEITKQ